LNKEPYTFDLRNSTNNTVADFNNAQINNPIFILKQEKIKIRKIFFTNREIKLNSIFFICSLLFSFIMFYLMFDSIFLSLFIVIALSIYGYILIKHRWFLNKGTIKYCNEKKIFAYNNSPNEINYSDIFRIEKEQSFISGTSFFIYTKEDRKAKIKFNFYDDIDTMDFEDKLKNKNISIHNL